MQSCNPKLPIYKIHDTKFSNFKIQISNFSPKWPKAGGGELHKIWPCFCRFDIDLWPSTTDPQNPEFKNSANQLQIALKLSALLLLDLTLVCQIWCWLVTCRAWSTNPTKINSTNSPLQLSWSYLSYYWWDLALFHQIWSRFVTYKHWLAKPHNPQTQIGSLPSPITHSLVCRGSDVLVARDYTWSELLHGRQS
jgi:hypothetical protein